MTNHQLDQEVEDRKEDLEELASSAEDAVENIREKSKTVLEDARDELRKNPVAFVVGALVFGFAVGCMVTSSRPQASRYQRFFDKSLDQANDLVSGASGRLNRAASNLKIW